jgi:checkpoint serine/threonine-protein kinase
MSAEWELSKENVLPVKRGRSAAVLSDVLGSEKLRKGNIPLEDEKSNQLEDSLVQAQGNPVAILAAYEEHFQWTRDAFPSDSSRLIKILERCTFDLKSELEMKNNSRFIKMWIEYVSPRINA